MRVFAIAAALAVVGTSGANAQVHVDGHVRKDGTYVPPHYRSAPDTSRQNNWSSQGNTNPYTGQQGHRDPYATSPPAYGSPQPNTFGQQRRY